MRILPTCLKSAKPKMNGVRNTFVRVYPIEGFDTRAAAVPQLALVMGWTNRA
jgi:hypothetical protein